jgi:DNA replication protein
MKKFTGFTNQETFTKIPDSFFHNLLTALEDRDELKVTLFALWQIGNMEGRLHFLRQQDFAACVPDPASALEKAVKRGSLLEVIPNSTGSEIGDKSAVLYFLNSPRGRAAAEAYAGGKGWSDLPMPVLVQPERPNIFKLYEQNIGPLTPIIADALKDAENTYPPEWVAEALETAVKNNKRNWKYVEAILRRWKEDGHAKKQDQRNTQEDGRRYSEGEFAEFLKHD